MKISILWFRQDLRLADNPALTAALQSGGAVVPVYIHAPTEAGDWPPGGASRWWLHQSLAELANDLQAHGSRLIIRQGSALETLQSLARETGATNILWNRRYEPAGLARDRQIKETLSGTGLNVQSFNASLLFEPWTIQNKSGKPFQVFTPFWRHCLTQPEPPAPVAAPRKVPGPSRWPQSLALEELALEPKINWADGLKAAWQPGAAGALANLKIFLKASFANYDEARNWPGMNGTSRLSPHLHFGEISPRQIWHGLRDHAAKNSLSEAAWRNSQYLTEVGWREFAHHLLYHFPHTASEPLRSEFSRFPWRSEREWVRAWQQGRTGYPIVDAGMRELWATGWMHNRVRMIVASFLVKDLMIHWCEGARWFWDTLVDADLASNTLGWQWTAGCGADAAPFFRIFNPVSQGEKFDGAGDYVRRWVPELRKLAPAWIHRPWEAPATVLAQAGVVLDRDYPKPIVKHAIAREIALEAYQKL